MEIRRIVNLNDAEVQQLSDLLVSVVAEGASVGFLPPVTRQEATAYWNSSLRPGVLLWVAEHDGEVVGTVQLHLAGQPNGSHRAEVSKLLVHPNARRKGTGRALMERAEAEARAIGRTLLVLDTRAGDPSNGLYCSMGFTETGRVPHYARSATGNLDTTVIYYRELV